MHPCFSHLVLPRLVAADAVVSVAVAPVEVEDEDQVSPLKHNQLVALVLARHVLMAGRHILQACTSMQ